MCCLSDLLNTYKCFVDGSYAHPLCSECTIEQNVEILPIAFPNWELSIFWSHSKSDIMVFISLFSSSVWWPTGSARQSSSPWDEPSLTMDEIKLGILPKNWNFIIGFKTTADSNYLCRSFAVLDYGTSLGLAKAVWAKDMMYHHYYWKAIDVSVDIVNKILVWLWSKPILVNLEPRASPLLTGLALCLLFQWEREAVHCPSSTLFWSHIPLWSVLPPHFYRCPIVQAQISTLELLMGSPEVPLSWEGRCQKSDQMWKWREGFSLSH